MAINDAQLLLTANQAAEALSISPRTLWSLTDSGQVPCVRIGRAVRYSVTELQRWVDAQATAQHSKGANHD